MLTETQQTPPSAQGEAETQKETPPSKAPGEVEGRVELHSRPQQKAFGGYDYKFVESPPSGIQTECPICCLVLRDPYLINCCGTNFCHSCSQRLQDEHMSCPTCRENSFKLFSNDSARHYLNQLHVLCTHSKDGCKWTGELGELERHLKEFTHSGGSFGRVS